MWKENGPKVRNGFREVLLLVTKGKKRENWLLIDNRILKEIGEVG